MLRQKIKKVFVGSPPPANGQPFQYLGDENKQDNDQSGEELANRQGRTQGDGHGEFHRHASDDEVGDRLLEDRIAAKQSRHECDHVEADEVPPEAQPTGDAGQGHEADPHQIGPLQGVFVAVVLRAVAVVVRPVVGRAARGTGLGRYGGVLVHGEPLSCEPVYFRYAFTTSINS